MEGREGMTRGDYNEKEAPLITVRCESQLAWKFAKLVLPVSPGWRGNGDERHVPLG